MNKHEQMLDQLEETFDAAYSIGSKSIKGMVLAAVVCNEFLSAITPEDKLAMQEILIQRFKSSTSFAKSVKEIEEAYVWRTRWVRLLLDDGVSVVDGKLNWDKQQWDRAVLETDIKETD